MYQNVNKPKSRPAKTGRGASLLPFCITIYIFFLCQHVNMPIVSCDFCLLNSSSNQKLTPCHYSKSNILVNSFFSSHLSGRFRDGGVAVITGHPPPHPERAEKMCVF